jgi:acyl-CoA dehydrogenase
MQTMTGFVVAVLLLAGFLTLAYLNVGLAVWTGVLGAALLAASLAGMGTLPGWLAWGVLLALNVAPLRRKLVTAPILRGFRSVLPSMSATEREALEAGTVWFDGELFAGRPDWSVLLDTPKPALTEAEQAFLDGPVETLCEMLDDWRITHELRDLPPEVWEFLKDNKFFGMIVPTSEGGLGFSAQAHSVVVAKISTRSITAAVTVMVPNSLGPAELLHRYGTEEQKHHYLPRLANGREIPCFSLTGPYAGSDAASLPDRGVVCHGEYQGERVLGLSVTWEKRYITLGPVATVLGLAFHASDPDHLLGDEPEPGITLALIPTDHPGVNIGRRHYPSGQAFMNGPNWGRNVFIPMSMVIGGPEQVGQGWRMLMNCLAAGRAISLPALGTAAAKMAARMSGAYARVRKQFKLPIGKLEGVEEALGRIGGEAYALEAARRLTCVALDQGHEPAVISAMLKYRATEGMRKTLNDAMDIHGGRGICGGPSNYLAAGYQAIPVGITVEGANILTRSLIVFGQGAMRCHPWLLKEIQAAQNPDTDRGLLAFDAALGSHVRYFIRNLARALVLNLTAGRFIRAPAEGRNHRWFQEATRSSTNFALVSDVALMMLGGELKRREKLSGRFADILVELYLVSSVLKRFEDDGRPVEDQPLVDWVCRNALYTIQHQMDEILENFPSRPVGWLLRRIVFPWGRLRRLPRDHVSHQIARLLMQPGAARDRITDGVYVNHDPEDITGRIEHALTLTLRSEPIERRIREAQSGGGLPVESGQDPVTAAHAAGIIDDAELDTLRSTERAVRLAIDVDDFAPEALSAVSSSTRRDRSAAA